MIGCHRQFLDQFIERHFLREVSRQALRVTYTQNLVSSGAAQVATNYQHRRAHLSERYRGVDDSGGPAFTRLAAGDEYHLPWPAGSPAADSRTDFLRTQLPQHINGKEIPGRD